MLSRDTRRNGEQRLWFASLTQKDIVLTHCRCAIRADELECYERAGVCQELNCTEIDLDTDEPEIGLTCGAVYTALKPNIEENRKRNVEADNTELHCCFWA
ncbi:hypothetical protein SKAU_G00368610 [Synaphobranchus kaupii]|uniref:Uncharacterized protein n=1 Tax=Synaphobranchus kaupii TaxID=118154 RepID=A0A9Q1EFL7_SYNKA|nr:hypothetical protein SKAU_G00368610 [Synaphobranchus kaupii]